jgi:hypothetical protein
MDAAQPSRGTSFVGWLGAETPESHVAHLHDEFGKSEDIFTWLVDASRYASGPETYSMNGVPEARVGVAAERWGTTSN